MNVLVGLEEKSEGYRILKALLSGKKRYLLEISKHFIHKFLRELSLDQIIGRAHPLTDLSIPKSAKCPPSWKC